MNRESHTCVRISHVANNFVMFLNNNETEIPEDQFEVYVVKLDAKDFCMPIKGQSKTTVTRICRLFTMNSSYWSEILDWCWSREIFILRFWSIEARDVSSSSITTCVSRRRRSDSMLEKWRKSSNIFFIALVGLVASGKHAWQEEVRENTKSRTKRGTTSSQSFFFTNMKRTRELLLRRSLKFCGLMVCSSIFWTSVKWHESLVVRSQKEESYRISEMYVGRIICMILDVSIKLHTLQHGLEDCDTKKYGQEIWTANEVLQLSFHHVPIFLEHW